MTKLKVLRRRYLNDNVADTDVRKDVAAVRLLVREDAVRLDQLLRISEKKLY